MQTETPRVETTVPRTHRRRVLQKGYGVYARPKRSRVRIAVRLLVIAAVVAGIILGTRAVASVGGFGNVLVARIENQQPVTVDLRAATPRSPQFFGVNVFPKEGTTATDGAYGFLAYDPQTVSGLRDMGVKMLRFPGGSWGEDHTPSLTQVDSFLALAHNAGAEPIMQVRVKGGTPQEAAALVSYTNNRGSPQRLARQGAPFVPVHFWVVGNEPDLRGADYTVADYTRDFIDFATAMKRADPTIEVLGPELSQYNGPNAGPNDATGTPWMSGFLNGIAAYERAHHVRLLDGVTIHRYPFTQTVASTSLLYSSATEWAYALPLLRDQVRQTLGRDAPIDITEINASTPGGSAPAPLATGLWWADVLGVLLEQQVANVDFFAIRGLDHPYSLLTTAGNPTPAALVMQLYTHMQPDVISLGTTGQPVSMYASTNSARDSLSFMLVNTSARVATVTVDADGILSPWGHPRIEMPPYAVACVVMRRDGHSTEYLYRPATGGIGPGTLSTVALS